MNHQAVINDSGSLVALPYSADLTSTSYHLPKDLSSEQWLEVGRALGRARGSLMWWIGDWWAYGEHNYGDRKAIVSADDWDGPSLGTCMNAATICRCFQTSSRDEVVSFRAHQAIAPLSDPDLRLQVLSWAATPAANGKRPTILAIEERVKQAKAFLAQGWTADQLDRKTQAESGQCVVANIREVDGRQIDAALLSWAESNSRFVRIDRKTDWGNPFEMPDDGDRDDVIDLFTKHYWPFKTALLRKAPSLAGKVLGCWCHPDPCHGHLIAECVNRASEEGKTVAQIADAISLADG